MKLAKNLGVAAIAATISIAAVDAKLTQAASIKYNFTVNSFSGDSLGQGSFQFDDSSLFGSGLETIRVEDGLTVAFNYLGVDYTETDDEFFDVFPIASFNNGQLLGLGYFVRDQFLIAGDLNNLDVGGDRFFTISQSVFTTEAGTVTYARVPEPLGIGGTAIATTLGLWLKRKKKAVVAS